ncbi:LysR family transcriptional regulator [Oryzifoliimicrobium ureilyticus]|uniref:LysR family transcriptional regulator n=1 Tax=Oryzifoliimicrobium ureilyticus TaxID=3113724 RepID=UPI0030761303
MSLLIDVVDTGSFSAAARKRRLPLTTITRKVSDLEAVLGAKLLVRTTRKLSLTDTGASYLAAARRIIDQVEEAERQAAGEFTEPRGELVITAPVQFGHLHVLPIVTDFLALFPEISIRLMLLDRNVHLVEDHVDMAVRIGRLADSSMIATSVGKMRTVHCASPQLLGETGIPQTVQDLRKMPCVQFDGAGSAPIWRFVNPATKIDEELEVASRLSVSTVEGALRAALRHAGVVRLLHYQVAEAVAGKRLQIILEAFEPPAVPVSLVHAAYGQMPLKMRRFLDYAAPRLKSVLSAL